MGYSYDIFPYRLVFKTPAGTSRGTYRTRDVWYIHLISTDHPGRVGIGECAPLPHLSCDDLADYETILRRCCDAFVASGKLDMEMLSPYPSMLFGLETALAHLHSGDYAFHQNSFSAGTTGIAINGLIWMGSFEQMHQQIERKLEDGFKCIKLKIGAIDFDQELALLQSIRSRFSVDDIELRVDANGAFDEREALHKLQQLSRYNLHSIEQPIKAGNPTEMAKLVQQSPIPIALDEELIGINRTQERMELLQTIQPHYIILKPSLHGGIAGSNDWIAQAEKLNIGWWATSALESNIGLNSIAQWCSTLCNPMPQGLGTGGLYINNIALPLEVRQAKLWYN